MVTRHLCDTCRSELVSDAAGGWSWTPLNFLSMKINFQMNHKLENLVRVSSSIPLELTGKPFKVH